MLCLTELLDTSRAKRRFFAIQDWNFAQGNWGSWHELTIEKRIKKVEFTELTIKTG